MTLLVFLLPKMKLEKQFFLQNPKQKKHLQRWESESMNSNFRKIKAIEATNKKRLLEVNPCLTEKSGIYFLTRTDEQGIKYAYIGQAKHILTRLAQHMTGHQHIDLSLKKHGFYSKDNLHGWNVCFMYCDETKLDVLEQKYILQYAADGYQLRNKTAGGQGEGKQQIDEYRPAKGYRDGIAQGKKTLARELASIADKHLVICLREDKKNNKISQKALEKFNVLLYGENE